MQQLTLLTDLDIYCPKGTFLRVLDGGAGSIVATEHVIGFLTKPLHQKLFLGKKILHY